MRRQSNGLESSNGGTWAVRDWEVEHGYNRPTTPNCHGGTTRQLHMKLIRTTDHDAAQGRSARTTHLASRHNWPRAAPMAAVKAEEATLEVMSTLVSKRHLAS